jgi:hypothetical protein
MAAFNRLSPHRFREPGGYSSEASRQREMWRKADPTQPVPDNFVGYARTHHAAKQGRKRTAGYSYQRQGGRDEARARAAERSAAGAAKRQEAYSAGFGGLKERDKMQTDPNFARAETPNLDAHFGGARPESSVRKPQRPAASTPPAAPGPLPGFPAPADNAGQTVGGMALDAFRKNRFPNR